MTETLRPSSLQIPPPIATNGFLDKAARLITGTSNVHLNEAEDDSQMWGSSISKEPFHDMDLLENGHAREYLAEECLSPTNTKSWSYSTVERTNKYQYKMFWNNDKFLLSAKQIEGTFYISQYEQFPEADGEGVPKGHYCAVLRKVTDYNFKLYNCGCEGCDMSFSTFTCSNTKEATENLDSTPPTKHGADRQLLADITHVTKVLSQVGSEMRCFNVVIPAVMADKRSRVVWCPRASRECTSTRAGGTPRSDRRRELVTSPSPQTKQSRFTFESPVSDRIKIASKLPVWCPEVNSLMLKFHGGRVREASAKNFILLIEDEPLNTESNSSEVILNNDDNDRILMQFGKFSRSKFALDFRYPLAPIQAFAIGLSACAWNVKSNSSGS